MLLNGRIKISQSNSLSTYSLLYILHSIKFLIAVFKTPTCNLYKRMHKVVSFI